LIKFCLDLVYGSSLDYDLLKAWVMMFWPEIRIGARIAFVLDQND
jgi:hypothetical protein